MSRRNPWFQGIYRPTPEQAKRYTSQQQEEFRDRERRIVERGGVKIGFFNEPGDAERAVWCVNACEGLDIVSLRAFASLGGIGSSTVVQALMNDRAMYCQQVKELAAMLSKVKTLAADRICVADLLTIDGLLKQAAEVPV